MKYFLTFVLVLASTIAYGQQIGASPLQAAPTYQPLFAKLNTNQLTSVNATLESKRNKNFVIDFKSLLNGTDLKNAEEHDFKVNYGVKTLFGGVLSANMSNTKNFGSTKENEYYGMSYSINKPNSSLNFSFKSADAINTQYKGSSTQILQFDYKAKF